METVTKSTSQARERLGQTLAALVQLLDQTMNEVQNIDSEFQERIRQTVQETEALVQQQSAERLKRATEETEQITRELVTEELEARFKQEIAAAVEAVRNTAPEWESERAGLVADYKRVCELLEQRREEHDRALAETDEAASIALERQIATAVERVRVEATIRWDSERTNLLAERDRAVQALAEASAQHRKAIEEFERVAAEDLERKMRTALEQWETERDGLVAEKQHIEQLLSEVTEAGEVAVSGQIESSSVAVNAVSAEVARVELLIQEISKVIEDPDTVLSIVIRKNAERTELESYLRGLRFTAGQ